MIAYRWDDPTRKAGEWTVAGRQSGARYLPLDLSLETLQDREDLPNNGRGYTYPLKHQDGFIEHVQFQFYLDGIHPHVTLVRRASSLARAHLLGELKPSLVP